MSRFFLPPTHWQKGQPSTLEGEEARHLSQVLRAKPGQAITVFDGQGRRASATLLTISRDKVSLELHETQTITPVSPSITLAQAIPKGKNMDFIVQKAVELGVSHIQPLITKNTIVQPGDGKTEKWRRTALEACKQCGQDTLPHIADPLPFLPWLTAQASNPATTGSPAQPLRLIASLAPGAEPFRQTLRAHPHTTAATLLIGPEGDFTPEETTAALSTGFLPVTLGTIILRVETATLFCLSALKYEFST